MSDEPPQPAAPLQAQLVAAGVALTTVIYMIVVMLLRATDALPDGGYVGLEPEVANAMGIILLVLGTAGVAASLPVRRFLVRRLTPESDNINARMRILLITMAICESSAIYGLVLALMGGLNTTVWILWGLSVAGHILLFPSRSWLRGRS